MERYEIVIHQEFQELFTLERLAATTGVHPDLVERFVDYGLLEPSHRASDRLLFPPTAVTRLRTIQRLRRDIGVGLPGIAIILDLTDKVRALQREVEWLRNQ
jgi:DNA-binding transcriptional MerR regulator